MDVIKLSLYTCKTTKNLKSSCCVRLELRRECWGRFSIFKDLRLLQLLTIAVLKMKVEAKKFQDEVVEIVYDLYGKQIWDYIHGIVSMRVDNMIGKVEKQEWRLFDSN